MVCVLLCYIKQYSIVKLYKAFWFYTSCVWFNGYVADKPHFDALNYIMILISCTKVESGVSVYVFHLGY